MADLGPELAALAAKLKQKPLPADVLEKAERMLLRLSAVQSAGGVSSYSLQELEITSKYIDWITSLPFGMYTQDRLDLAAARQILDQNHYGLSNVKERVLEFIATKALQAQTKAAALESASLASSQITPQFPPTPHPLGDQLPDSPILCFIGVQGVGKTTMAKAIAECMGRSFGKVALGAFASVHEIRGRSRSELGAEPGQIVKTLIRAGSMNPVILLDEMDKVSDSTGLRADIMAALLEILDPEQNKSFVDRYLDFPIDLSQVIFITTANNLNGISSALLDRLDLVRFSSYTDEEKQQIARNYLLPKVRAKTGIGPDKLDFSEDVWSMLIRPLGFDPGIRQLERNLTNLSRKVAKMIIEGYAGKITITPANFKEFFPEEINVYT